MGTISFYPLASLAVKSVTRTGVYRQPYSLPTAEQSAI